MSCIPTSAFAKTDRGFFNIPIAYGSFSSTQSQQVNPAFPTLAVLSAVYDTEDLTPTGMKCSLPDSAIVVGATGVYKILASAQCDKTTALVGDLEMWIAVNGTAVPNSATRTAINQNQEVVMAVEWLVELEAGDAIEIQFASTTSGLEILAVPAASPVPEIPSIITTVLRIA